MAVLLIRHGETDLNAARVVQFPDTPLGKDGKLQAEQLGQSLQQRSIELVLSSDYVRARMTAERIAAHAGTKLIESHHLRERNFGDIRGTSYDELGELDIFAADYAPPGGETWETFNARVDLAWTEVTAHAQTVSGDLAVVTHGLVLRSLIERVLDVSGHPPESDLVVANTSVTIVDDTPPWRVIEFASVSHLEQDRRTVTPV
jgi:probable phosphoglycerate mutase